MTSRRLRSAHCQRMAFDRTGQQQHCCGGNTTVTPPAGNCTGVHRLFIVKGDADQRQTRPSIANAPIRQANDFTIFLYGKIFYAAVRCSVILFKADFYQYYIL